MCSRFLRILCVLVVVIFISGFKGALIVVEGGSIISASGNYDCSEGTNCVIDNDDPDFTETFTAEPREGYDFANWVSGDSFLCGSEVGPVCIVPTPTSPNPGKGKKKPKGDGEPTGIYSYLMPEFIFVGIDTDGDGTPDHLDDDDDNDGILDLDDPCPLEPNPDCGINEVSGVFYEDVYWRKEDGPYLLVGVVTIPDYFNLHIEEGVQVSSADDIYRIRVGGNIFITGTETQPVQMNNTQILAEGNVGSSISIDLAQFSGPGTTSSFSVETTGTALREISIKNSVFLNSRLNITRMITGSLIEGNQFDNTYVFLEPSIFTGEAYAGVNKNIFSGNETRLSAKIEADNNLFLPDGTLSFNFRPILRDNTFLWDPSTGGINKITGPVSGHSVDASYNYWGTTDPRVIDLVIFDINDTSSYGAVEYLPVLEAPHPDTPTVP